MPLGIEPMLETIIVILVVLWLLGFLAFHLGAFVHALIVIAIVVFVIRMLRGGSRAL